MAIDINLGLSAEATGTVDVITATYSPAPTLVDRKILFLRTLGTNLTTTPTFNPNGLGALTIVKQGGVALAVGDLKGDVILMYNLANTQWELINPLVPIVTGTNTGDETAARIGTIVNAATDLPTPLDADKVGIWDSLNSLYKAVTWANIKVTLKAYFDTVYAPVNKDKTIGITTTPISHTGTLTETYIYGIPIPVGTYITNDRLYQEILVRAVGGGGIKTIRTYFNTTNNLAGTPVLFSTYFTNNLLYSFGRNAYLNSPTTMKSYLLSTTNAAWFSGSSNSSMGTFTVDFTVQQYLVISFQLANAADTIYLESLILQRNRL